MMYGKAIEDSLKCAGCFLLIIGAVAGAAVIGVIYLLWYLVKHISITWS